MRNDPWDIRRSVRRNLLFSFVSLGVLGAGFGGWAANAELAGAVTAQGTLVVDSSVKKVQHPTGGVVGELRVYEGDLVKAGDVLLRLDETVTRANLEVVDKGLVESWARQARLEAERDGSASLTNPPELTSRASDDRLARAMAGERKLFELRLAARNGQRAQLRERVRQIADEISGLNEQLAGKRQERTLIGKELAGVRDLWQKNLVSIQRVTALERDAARLDGEHGQLIASIAQAKGKSSETELQILQVDADLRTEVAKELREVQAKIGELQEKRVAAQDQLTRIEIRAPQDGYVHQLVVHASGAVIGPGEAVMTIVPSADRLVVEARISPRDIDQIRFGQPAAIRFPSFNQRTTPEVLGEVSLVAPDQSTDEKTGASYFKVNVTPKPDELAKLKGVKLVPGMPADTFVQTGSRTVLSYLVKPLTDQIMHAFRES